MKDVVTEHSPVAVAHKPTREEELVSQILVLITVFFRYRGKDMTRNMEGVKWR